MEPFPRPRCAATTGWGLPETAEEIARWVNAVLGVKAHKGVSARDEGVLRLARWIDNRLATRPNARLGEKELLARAAQWIPDCFAGVEIDFEHLRVWPKVAREAEAQQAAFEIPVPVDNRAEEAIACLDSDKPQRQVARPPALGRPRRPGPVRVVRIAARRGPAAKRGRHPQGDAALRGHSAGGVGSVRGERAQGGARRGH